MSSSNEEPPSVVFGSRYGIRTIELNRPKKLNSLNGEMIDQIVPRLVQWQQSDMANMVLMKGAGDKAFCAGGDVAALAKHNQEPDGQEKSVDYFRKEYQLDHLIATYQKPYIAFMDGITMGGGVGLSIHAPIRIATERTVFAMPETTIGFFPDVGASFFLPRMNGSVGTYLALTSERLRGPDVFYSGIATHYMHSTSLKPLEHRLAELGFADNEQPDERLRVISDAIEEFCTGLPHDQPMLLQGELRNAIDRCFCHNTVEEIMAALQKEEGITKEWATATLETLHKRSPLSVYVTLRQMRTSRNWSIAETFQKEHAMAIEFMKNSDFTEGVTALLVRKDAPKWSIPTLEDVASHGGAGVTDRFFNFQKVKQQDRLQLLSDGNYHEYPHTEYVGVPTEEEVKEAVLTDPKQTRDDVARRVVESRKGRLGIDVVVREILERKTRVGRQEGQDLITWVEK